MSLFNKLPQNPPFPAKPSVNPALSAPFGTRRRVIVIDEPKLPDFVRKLQQMCKHPSHLPCWMHFAGDGTTAKGHAFARYRCPICGAEQGWGIDYRSGKPLRLFITDAAKR